MNFLEFDPSVVCHYHSLISFTGCFSPPSSFTSSYFCGRLASNMLMLSILFFLLSLIYVPRQPLSFLHFDLLVVYCQLHSTFLYDLSFWPDHFALVSLHPELRYVLYLFKNKNKNKNTHHTHLASPRHPSPPQTTLSAFFFSILLMWQALCFTFLNFNFATAISKRKNRAISAEEITNSQQLLKN